MKKNISLFVLFLLMTSCDDGDLAIETINFDAVSPNHCDVLSPTLANVLFKINTNEALILELPALAIANQEKASTEFKVKATGDTKVTYRIFSDVVDSNYFCNTIPLTEPKVINEIIAKSGTVLITTVLDAVNETYNHTIKLTGISLVTSKNERITDLSISNFGEVTTKIEETNKKEITKK